MKTKSMIPFDQFDSFVEDLLGEKSDRTVVIIGASKVDDMLFRILIKHLLPKISGAKDDLLEGDQPIGTFSSRIKLVYRLGIVDRKLFHLLDQIRKIRNRSAHELEFHIKKPPTRDHLLQVKSELILRPSFILSKQRYFNNVFNTDTEELQCIFVSLCVVLEAIHAKIKTTKGMKHSIEISKK